MPSAVTDNSPELRGLVAAGGSFSAGKVSVLGLQQIKERLGERWERASGHIHTYFEAALRQACKPGDVVCRTDDLSFVVMFRDLSLEHAQRTCSAIAEMVCRQMFGQDGEDVSVRTLVGEVDEDCLRADADVTKAVERRLERSGKAAVISSNNLVNQSESGAGQEPWRLTYTSAGADEPPLASAAVTFTYRPIWDCTRNVMLLYLCQPRPESATLIPDDLAGGLCLAEGRGQRDQAGLDILVLEECARRITDLKYDGKRVLIAAPLHFSTITRPRMWERYSAAWRIVPDDIACDLVFLVFGIHQGVPPMQLLEELPKVKRRARQVFCAVYGKPAVSTRFANTGIEAVGIVPGPKHESDKPFIDGTRLLARNARSVGMNSFVLGAHSRSVVLSAVDAGIRYIEGAAVRAPTADPCHAFSRTIEDLYQPMAAQQA